uniref:Uncharacterized protein n=1 Tax=Octopus bimaculoides TaxID=37653 RepID=A0A0L8FRN1_OCTBM
MTLACLIGDTNRAQNSLLPLVTSSSIIIFLLPSLKKKEGKKSSNLRKQLF